MERDTADLEHQLGLFGGNERRTFPVVFDEVRDSGAGAGQFTVSGYAAVYDKPSLDLGGFREFIRRGAFDSVLAAQPRVTLTIDHDTRYTLATTKNRTLELSTDQNGLKFWARVAPTQYAQDLRLLMERGDVDEASFVFNVDTGGQEWRTADDGSVERDITRVTGLHDVCVTSAAAYPDATANLVRARALIYANQEGLLPLAAPPEGAGEEDVSRKGTADSRKRLLTLRAKSRSAALSHPFREGAVK